MINNHKDARHPRSYAATEYDQVEAIAVALHDIRLTLRNLQGDLEGATASLERLSETNQNTHSVLSRMLSLMIAEGHA